MADETTPITEDQARLIEQAKEAQDQYNASTKSYGDVVQSVTGMLGDFRRTLAEVGTNLQNVDKLSEKGKAAFFGFGLAAVKAQESFKGFSGMDLSKISTFGGHLDDLKKMIASGGTAASTAMERMNSLKDSFIKSGRSASEWNAALRLGPAAVLDLVKNMMTAADVGIKMQESQLKMAASTGTLDNMFQKAGGNLQNMTVLVDEQNKMMNLSMGATNSTSEQIQEYYYALGKVPGALRENVAGTSLLTATIKLAHGTGMDQIQITNDMHDSYKKFGMTGADSIKFIARFSELSNDLGVEIEDMRAGLIGATDGFKGLVDTGASAARMTEGITAVMKEYVKGLKETGMSSKDAIAAATHLTDSFKGLNVAQRAFLSAQTGGPGGLMGAAKIEEMLRKGDTKGVEKLVMQQIQQQTGKAVSLEEATKSEAAAATRQRQIMILQQGPLGNIAKTPEDAGRLLETMKARQEGRPTAGPSTELRENVLEKAMKNGSTWEKQTHTVVSDMATDVAGIRDQLATMSLNAVKGTLTSAATTDKRQEEKLTAAERQARKDLDDRAANFARQGATQVKNVARDMAKPGVLTTDRSDQYQKESVMNLAQTASTVPTAVQKVGSVAMRAGQAALGTGGGDTSPAGERQKIFDEAQQRRGTATTRAAIVQNQLKNPPKKREIKLPGTPSLDLDNFGEVPTAAAQVGSAQRGQPGPKRTPATGGGAAGAPEVVVSEDSPAGRFKVEVKVSEIDSAHSTSVAPGSNVTP